MTRIVVQGVTVARAAGFRLGPVDVEVPAGARLVLWGPSGAGKTTLLRVLAGLEVPNHGRVTLDDRVVNDPGPRIAPARRGVAMVFQSLALWPHMTALAQVRFAGSSRALATQLLERVGLGRRLRQRPGELSGGEAQRLALARALAGGQRLLLLDEPFRSVDPDQRRSLVELVLALHAERGLTSVLVTHDAEEARAFGTTFVEMRDGHVVSHDPPVVAPLFAPETVT